jgi:Transcriptional regulator, AbiEi antitoxin, Type IV TA system/Transcriptional regulator, AbiEi antitoxin N-terminal domain
MGIQKGRKLNLLQSTLPEGLPVDAHWLDRKGYSRGLRSKYVAHGWLDRVARSVYRRPAPTLSAHEKEGLRWEDLVVSLQRLLECDAVVGGRTALELQGFAHYLSATGPREVHLYGPQRLPAWVAKLKLDSRIVFHSSRRLFDESVDPAWRRGIESEDNKQVTDTLRRAGLTEQNAARKDWQLIMSLPERAVLELLNEVPEHETFHQADMLMDGLRNLSPRRLQTLLVGCRNVKVKRLFFWFAERHKHSWLKELDQKAVDLGKGKRMIVRGGKLDTKFNITVPGNLNGGL